MRHTKVVTRKPHRCYACHRSFPKGTSMVNWMNIYEGEFCWGYTCETCEQIMSLSDEHEFPEGFVSEAWPVTPEELLTEMIHDKCKRSLARIGTLGMPI